MNLIELERALRQLRLGGMAAVLETRLRQVSVAAKKGAIMAGRKGPAMWLRYGLRQRAHKPEAESSLSRPRCPVALRQLWLPWGNRTTF